jgi:hypothetical protein
LSGLDVPDAVAFERRAHRLPALARIGTTVGPVFRTVRGGPDRGVSAIEDRMVDIEIGQEWPAIFPLSSGDVGFKEIETRPRCGQNLYSRHAAHPAKKRRNGRSISPRGDAEDRTGVRP